MQAGNIMSQKIYKGNLTIIGTLKGISPHALIKLSLCNAVVIWCCLYVQYILWGSFLERLSVVADVI